MSIQFVDSEKKPWNFEDSGVCMWDLHPFQGRKVGYPYALIGFNKVVLKGCFCSTYCMKRFVFDKPSLVPLKLSIYVDKISKQQNEKTIIMAHPREVLEMFGGFMSIDEFRKETEVIYNVEIPFEEISSVGLFHATCTEDLKTTLNFSRKPFSSTHATAMIKEKLKVNSEDTGKTCSVLENFMNISKKRNSDSADSNQNKKTK